MSGKLSSGFRSSAVVFDGSMAHFVNSGAMTLATGGAGDLLNGSVHVPFDCYAAGLVLTKVNNSSGTTTNAKLSIGTTTDVDCFVDSLPLATYLTSVTGKRVYTLLGTGFFNGARGNRVPAGSVVVFELDAGALTATHRMEASLILVPTDQDNKLR